MTYIPAAGVSTHRFFEEHRKLLLALAEYDYNAEKRRDHAMWELEDIGLMRCARAEDYGQTVTTERGHAMVAYLRERGEDWR